MTESCLPVPSAQFVPPIGSSLIGTVIAPLSFGLLILRFLPQTTAKGFSGHKFQQDQQEVNSWMETRCIDVLQFSPPLSSMPEVTPADSMVVRHKRKQLDQFKKIVTAITVPCVFSCIFNFFFCSFYVLALYVAALSLSLFS
jgi:hypothetical protein